MQLYRKSNGEIDSNYLYKRVTLTGRFDFEHQVLIGLRSAPEAKRVTAETGKSPSSEQGFHVITPFITTDKFCTWKMLIIAFLLTYCIVHSFGSIVDGFHENTKTN